MCVSRVAVPLSTLWNRMDRNLPLMHFTIRRSLPIGLCMIRSIRCLRCCLYCDYKKEERGSAIPNHKKLSLCRAEWKKQSIELNLPTPRSRAAYYWLLENNPTYARYISRHDEILASETKNRFYFTTANLFVARAWGRGCYQTLSLSSRGLRRLRCCGALNTSWPNDGDAKVVYPHVCFE